MSWLYEHQWAEWEIITISLAVLFVLVWITKRQRNRAVRKVYKDQFLEGSPVIGANLGNYKRSRRVNKDLKKGRFAAVKKRRPKQQKWTRQKESSAKLHEQIKQLQREIIKRKQSEVRLEEKVTYLTTANEKLQLELAENKQYEEPSEQQIVEKPSAEKLFQPEASESKQAEQQVTQELTTGGKQQLDILQSEQAGQEVEEQVADEPVTDKPAERKPARRKKSYEDFHRVVDDVKQKLCRKCNEWKPESEFHKNASSKDGLAGSCKTCTAQAAKEYRKRRKAAQD